MKKMITMQQIAGELNLSRATVSAVINNTARKRNISEATIIKVRSYLKKRGYVPSRQALSLRLGTPNSVGILYCGHLYSHLTEAFNKIIEHFNSTPKGIEIMVVKQNALIRGLKELIARGITKLIWIHTLLPEEELQNFNEIQGFLKNVDTIIYNYRSDGGYWDEKLSNLGVQMIGIDRQKGYRNLALFLKKLNHISVAICQQTDFITKNMSQFQSTFGEAGIKAVYLSAEERPADSSQYYWTLLSDKIMTAMKEHSITAACFLDDEIAGMTMAELIKRGIKVPEDLTVTGFDGLIYTQAFAPPLTTLRIPVPDMVNQVIRVAKKKSSVQKHCFEPELVVRESHAPRPKQD